MKNNKIIIKEAFKEQCLFNFDSLIKNLKNKNYKTVSKELENFILSIGLRQYSRSKDEDFLKLMGMKSYTSGYKSKDIKEKLKIFKDKLSDELDVLSILSHKVSFGNNGAIKMIIDSIHPTNIKKTYIHMESLIQLLLDIGYIDESVPERNISFKVFEYISSTSMFKDIEEKYRSNMQYYFIAANNPYGFRTVFYDLDSTVFYEFSTSEIEYSICFEMLNALGENIYQKDFKDNDIFNKRLSILKSKIDAFTNVDFKGMSNKMFFADTFVLYILSKLRSGIAEKFGEHTLFDVYGLKIIGLGEHPQITEELINEFFESFFLGD